MTSSVPLPTQAADEAGPPHDTHVGVSRWIADHKLIFQKFVGRALQEFDPQQIVLVGRHGRLIELLGLLPDSISERITYPSSFNWLPTATGTQEKPLAGQRVLVLDESIQDGQELHKLRMHLEGVGAIVKSLVLVRRRSWFDAGLIAEPQAQVCLDLSDMDFDQASAELSSVLESEAFCLDVDHFPTCEFHLPKPISALVLTEALGILGPIHFVSPTVAGGEILSFTIDQPRFFEWSELKLPPSLSPEGVCKLRAYYHVRRGVLTLIPMTFPAATLSADDIIAFERDHNALWSAFLRIPVAWSDLPMDGQVDLLYRLLCIYCSTQLLLQVLPHLSRLFADLGALGGSESILLSGIELRRVFGRVTPIELYRTVEGLVKGAWLMLAEHPLWRAVPILTAQGREAPAQTDAALNRCYYQVLDKLGKLRVSNTGNHGHSFSELQQVTGCGSSSVSRILDFCLDQGQLKPQYDIRFNDGRYYCLRTYRITERGIGANDKT